MDEKSIIRGVIREGLGAVALAGWGQMASLEARTHGLQDEALASRCEARPPPAALFEPELEWAWTGSDVFPKHINVMMTPVVVDTNADGVPDVVFNSYEGENYVSNGILRAIDGATGRDRRALPGARCIEHRGGRSRRGRPGGDLRRARERPGAAVFRARWHVQVPHLPAGQQLGRTVHGGSRRGRR